MSKKLWIAVAMLLVAATLALGVAAEDVVYVPASANTLANAVAKLPSGGTVIVTSPLTVPATTLAEVSGNLTVKAEGNGALLLSGDLTFAKNENDNVITLDLPLTANGHAILGGFNSIVFGENFVVSDSVDFYGGVLSTEGVRGSHDANRVQNAKYITELPYSITVNGGTFGTFSGGNLRREKAAMIGAVAAPLTVTVNGGTFNRLFTLSGMSVLADNATLTVNGGVFNAPVYAQGSFSDIFTDAKGKVTEVSTSSNASYCSILTGSDKKYYAADGDIALTLNGGTFNGGVISAYDSRPTLMLCLRGNFALTVGEGATFADGTVLDATQVKAYVGESTEATLVCPDASEFNVVRFDSVNGEAKEYTEPLRISFIGDSITQGYGATKELTKSYSAYFKTMAEDAGKEVIVGNYGVGSAYILPHGNGHYNDTLAHKMAYSEADSDYVLIALGTNDAAYAGATYGQTVRFSEMYEAFLRLYGDLPTTKRLFTTSAIYRLTSSMHADVRAVSIIRPIQKKVTEKLMQEDPAKYTYVDLYALLYEAAVTDALFANDKLHPDADGYGIYAEAVYNAIFGGVYTVENFEMTDVYLSANGSLTGAGTKDDPMSSLTTAFARLTPTGTLHVIGEYVYGEKVNTPLYMDKLTITGEGEGASFGIKSDIFSLSSDTVFTNIHYTATAAYPTMVNNWNNLELTDSFTCTDKLWFYAGQSVYNDNPDRSTTHYDSTASASTDKDCTITVNGGSYFVFLGGNRRMRDDSPYGTYSGNMTLTIGEGVTIKTNALNAINGQNYNAGKIVAYINSWPAGQVCREYARPNSLDTPNRFNESFNTGTVEMHFGDKVSAVPAICGDFDGDMDVDLADAFLMLDAVVDGGSATEMPHFYNNKSVTMLNVLRALKKLVR